MADDNDGMGEALNTQLRTALAVALQLGQRFAHLREELARTSQARTEQQARELQARDDAERLAVVASLAPVALDDWWSRAAVDDIAAAYETAEAWRLVDGRAGRAWDHIGRELRDRYGIDVADLAADPVRVREQLELAERDRANATSERAESAKEAADGTELLAAAERLTQDANQRGRQQDGPETSFTAEGGRWDEILAEAAATRDLSGHAYDTAERRKQWASDLEKAGLDSDLVRVRVIADLDNATHPNAAVTSWPGRQPRAHGSSAVHSVQRERDGLSR